MVEFYKNKIKKEEDCIGNHDEIREGDDNGGDADAGLCRSRRLLFFFSALFWINV